MGYLDGVEPHRAQVTGNYTGARSTQAHTRTWARGRKLEPAKNELGRSRTRRATVTATVTHYDWTEHLPVRPTATPALKAILLRGLVSPWGPVTRPASSKWVPGLAAKPGRRHRAAWRPWEGQKDGLGPLAIKEPPFPATVKVIIVVLAIAPEARASGGRGGLQLPVVRMK